MKHKYKYKHKKKPATEAPRMQMQLFTGQNSKQGEQDFSKPRSGENAALSLSRPQSRGLKTCSHLFLLFSSSSSSFLPLSAVGELPLSLLSRYGHGEGVGVLVTERWSGVERGGDGLSDVKGPNGRWSSPSVYEGDALVVAFLLPCFLLWFVRLLWPTAILGVFGRGCYHYLGPPVPAPVEGVLLVAGVLECQTLELRRKRLFFWRGQVSLVPHCLALCWFQSCVEGSGVGWRAEGVAEGVLLLVVSDGGLVTVVGIVGLALGHGALGYRCVVLECSLTQFLLLWLVFGSVNGDTTFEVPSRGPGGRVVISKVPPSLEGGQPEVHPPPHLPTSGWR
ncbi:hypothetical protein Taro_030663 [Colocasia esculenta]|uniref:Uncharacterized protein n=1 Tax=Colocasia esculenta TaxID=4460 RepID=A0A843VYL3_COLES|nr:hypothetical protein [Colocasia esculenta]